MRHAQTRTTLIAMSLIAASIGAAHATTYNVTNGATLATALGKVVAGDIVIMAAGTYDGSSVSGGKFLINRSGAKNNPITLQGVSGSIIKNAGAYGLALDGASYWKLTGFTVDTVSKAIMLDNSHHVLIDGVTAKNIDQEAIHFRKGSHDNVLTNSKISDTGKADPMYGEAVYVGSAKSNWASIMGSSSTADGSTKNCISKNTIGPNVTAEAIDIKEGSSYTSVLSNTFDIGGISGANSADSALDIKGQYVYVYGNTVKNSKSTFLAAVTDINGATTVTKVTPDAFQTHEITNPASAPSGTKVYVWGNTVDLKSASKPSGYTAGTAFKTDGNGTNYFCSAPGTNTVASGDLTSNLSASSCTTALASVATTCPAVLTQ
ncbi:MAG: peptide transporter substrate-binding protein [Rhodocyclales bacterium]|nr:peptide transporter substrate-binding protein [Rhodocyclales bacterium]